jgi:hypothetical protein
VLGCLDKDGEPTIQARIVDSEYTDPNSGEVHVVVDFGGVDYARHVPLAMCRFPDQVGGENDTLQPT